MSRWLAIALGVFLWGQAASAAGAQVFTATLSGAQQVPAVSSSGTGTGTVVLNAGETPITVDLTFSGLTSTAIAAHIHGAGAAGTNAGVLFDFSAATPAATAGSIPQQTFAITPAQVADLKAGLYYFNIHTTNFSGGEIRGQISSGPAISIDRTSLRFGATSSGSAFVQQTPSQTVRISQTGTGTVTFTATSSAPWLVVSPTSGNAPAGAHDLHAIRGRPQHVADRHRHPHVHRRRQYRRSDWRDARGQVEHLRRLARLRRLRHAGRQRDGARGLDRPSQGVNDGSGIGRATTTGRPIRL
jgi:Cu/Zn superoxide dismutase